MKQQLQLMVMALSLLTAPVCAQETSPTDQIDAEMQKQVINTIQTVVNAAKANIEAGTNDTTPNYPKVISDAAKRGAQIQYLGEKDGFTGWILLDKAGATYVYVSVDEQTVFQGLMYDGEGKPVTVGQIAEAQMRNPAFFGLAEAPTQTEATAVPTTQPKQAAQTPAETLYNALSVSNFVKLGSQDDTAPILYAFMDPDCPHCHDFLKDIDKDYLTTGAVQLRIIPIGLLGEDSKRRAAYTLAQADGAAQFLAHAKGVKPMPTPANMTLDGQQLNLDLFKLWRFDGTPIFVYKDKMGQIMMVRGAPKDMKAVTDAIATGGA